MDREIILALLALLGSLTGTFAGIFINSRLVNYRLSQLEAKMDKHNQVIDRVYILERQEAVMEEELRVADRRIRDLEVDHK